MSLGSAVFMQLGLTTTLSMISIGMLLAGLRRLLVFSRAIIQPPPMRGSKSRPDAS
jgi:hypothetical protein